MQRTMLVDCGTSVTFVEVAFSCSKYRRRNPIILMNDRDSIILKKKFFRLFFVRRYDEKAGRLGNKV